MTAIFSRRHPEKTVRQFRILPQIAVVAMLLTVGACSGSGSGPAAQSYSKLCGGLLGEEGGAELSRITGHKEFVPLSDTEQDRLSAVAQKMKKATGTGSGLSSICSFKVGKYDPESFNTHRVDIKSGWQDLPETVNGKYPSGHRHYFFSSGSAISDVSYEKRVTTTTYFPCRTSDGSTRMAATTFRGDWASIEDQLPKDEGKRARHTVLLAASSKLSGALGCTNKPQLSPADKIEQLGSDAYGRAHRTTDNTR